MTLDTLGFVAGGLTTISFVPQVVRIWRMQSARELSYGMFAIFSLGVALWLTYGIALGAWPIIIANAATLALAIAVLVLKWRFEARQAGETKF